MVQDDQKYFFNEFLKIQVRYPHAAKFWNYLYHSIFESDRSMLPKMASTIFEKA